MKHNTTQRILAIAKPVLKTLVLLGILSLFVSLAEILKPYVVKIIIDDFISKNTMGSGMYTIYTVGAAYIVVVIIANILDYLQKIISSIMGENIVYNMRNKLFSYVQKAKISFHDKTPAGKLFVRITNDTEDILSLFKEVITTIIKEVLMLVGIIIVMLMLNTKLSLLSFVIIPLIVVFTLFITRTIKKAYEYCKKLTTKINIFLSESIYGIKIIKIFNRHKEKEKECKELTKEYWHSRFFPTALEAILPTTIGIIESIGISIVVVSSINNFWSVGLDVGLVYVFITYIRKFFEPIISIVEKFETIQEAAVSVDKIYEILEVEENLEDLNTGLEMSDIKGKIEFRNVWFSYNKKDWVLEDVSFTVNPGESIALVGKTGSGKTTIINLINRFYDIDKGEILIDGINIKDINLKSLRKNIGVVLQDPFIFAKSIKTNITLNTQIDDDKVEEAVRFSSANEFISKQKDGIMEIAKERGEAFSNGEKQLIAFARIFAHNPSIFVLDEATANIDTKTEEAIQRSIDKICREKTSIFIAHRLSTIKNVDKIIVMDKGTIVEAGNHSELIKADGYYSNLYKLYYNQMEA